MARCIYDIDFCILIVNCCIFRKYRDTALAFNIIGVHDAILDLLVFAEDTALFQKLIHQRCFAVVNMGNNCYISDVFSFRFHK